MNEISILEKEVVQANPLIEARKHMNLSEMRLFLLGLQGIKPNISTDGNIHDVEFHDIWVSPSQLERLFSGNRGGVANLKRVAPHAGAWIEIAARRATTRDKVRRAPHGARGLQSEIHRQEDPPHMSCPTRA